MNYIHCHFELSEPIPWSEILITYLAEIEFESFEQNKNIVDAYIQFTADASTSGSMSITIKGENVTNSATFSNVTNNISSRATTSSSVLWNPLAWTNNLAGTNERTPDLSAIVSEIMTSNGWINGNPITFIITGTGNATDYRKADSFDESA